MTKTQATLTPGTTFRNGVDALTTHDAPWGTELTVVALDEQTYGNTRYVVSTPSGRRAFALALWTY